MRNKWIKKCLIFFSTGCLMFAAAGCSQVDTLKEKAQGVADQVMGNTDEEEEEQEEEEVVQEPEVEVAKPELTTNLSGSVTYKVGDTAKALTVEATTSDGGTITYQWYQSSTNKNGGGTPIDGATENTYVPSTKEEGTMYYYAVTLRKMKDRNRQRTVKAKQKIPRKRPRKMLRRIRADFNKDVFFRNRIEIFLFPRATSQADMLAYPFGGAVCQWHTFSTDRSGT